MGVEASRKDEKIRHKLQEWLDNVGEQSISPRLGRALAREVHINDAIRQRSIPSRQHSSTGKREDIPTLDGAEEEPVVSEPHVVHKDLLGTIPVVD